MTEGGPGPSHADLAMLRAIQAWGGGDLDGLSSRLSAEWRERLRLHWNPDSIDPPDEARAELVETHSSSVRPDASRVHPSWFARALQGESKAARLAVASQVGESLRLNLSEGRVQGEADPEAVGWALALWAERLVGDRPNLRSDPPVVVALTSLRPRDLLRLIKTCGVAKLAFATTRNAPVESIARFAMHDRVRFGYFRRHIGVAEPRLVELAGLDIELIEGHRRHGLARLGLVTIGRLIAEVEPYRARWALQHLPYPIAKLTRSLGAMPSGRKSPLAWEAWLLDAAWSRLFHEGWKVGLVDSSERSVPGVES